jgi:hypothetical protein
MIMAILGAQSCLAAASMSMAALGGAAVRFSWLAVRVLTIMVANALSITISNNVGDVRVPHVREQPVSA